LPLKELGEPFLARNVVYQLSREQKIYEMVWEIDGMRSGTTGSARKANMSNVKLRFSWPIILLMPAYWLAYIITGAWMVAHLIPMKLLWMAEVENWQYFEEKLYLKMGLILFYVLTGLIIGIFGQTSANRSLNAA
jgi:ABC-type proline/glycine betaine transport system permease subunit